MGSSPCSSGQHQPARPSRKAGDHPSGRPREKCCTTRDPSTNAVWCFVIRGKQSPNIGTDPPRHTPVPPTGPANSGTEPKCAFPFHDARLRPGLVVLLQCSTWVPTTAGIVCRLNRTAVSTSRPSASFRHVSRSGPIESSDQCFFVHNIKQCNCEEGADAMFADRELPECPPMCTVSPVELEEFRPDRNTGDDLTRWLKSFRFPIPWQMGVNR